MVNPSARESRYRDRPESNSRQNFARLTGTRVTRVNSRVQEKNAQSELLECLKVVTHHQVNSGPSEFGTKCFGDQVVISGPNIFGTR